MTIRATVLKMIQCEEGFLRRHHFYITSVVPKKSKGSKRVRPCLSAAPLLSPGVAAAVVLCGSDDEGLRPCSPSDCHIVVDHATAASAWAGGCARHLSSWCCARAYASVLFCSLRSAFLPTLNSLLLELSISCAEYKSKTADTLWHKQWYRACCKPVLGA